VIRTLEIAAMKTTCLGTRLVYLLLIAVIQAADPVSVAADDTAALAQGARPNDVPVCVREPGPLAPPLFAGLFHDIIGNRTRIIQASFVCIVIGIFILWKK
jgi:hypothetical protein